MAGDWIKVEHALPDKPEVMEIATTLGIDSDAVVGKLIRVWTWFDNHTEDGNAPVTVRALLERYTNVTGFVTSMLQVGWMEEKDGMLSVARFDRHNGQTAKNRANTNRRVTKSRKCNGASVTNVTLRALQKPLPEKRREDIKEIEKKSCKGKADNEFEVIDYVLSLGLPKSDGSYIWNSWEAGGWKRGGEPLKDWKAAARAWKQAGYFPSQKSAQALQPLKRATCL